MERGCARPSLRWYRLCPVHALLLATLVALLIVTQTLVSAGMARALGVGVREVAIGAGPSIRSFTRGETVYSLRAFPVLSYVAWVGATEEDDAGRPDAFHAQPVGRRAVITASGPIAIGLIAAIASGALYVWFPARWAAPWTSWVGPVRGGLGAVLSGLRTLGLALSLLHLLPLGGTPGGQLLLLAVEALTGSPVRPETRARLAVASTAALLALAAVLVAFDVGR